jgi:hypothetical protein
MLNKLEKINLESKKNIENKSIQISGLTKEVIHLNL